MKFEDPYILQICLEEISNDVNYIGANASFTQFTSIIPFSPSWWSAHIGSCVVDELLRTGDLCESITKPLKNIRVAFEYISSAESIDVRNHRIVNVVHDTVAINALTALSPAGTAASGVAVNVFVENYRMSIIYDDYLRMCKKSIRFKFGRRISYAEFIGKEELNARKLYKEYK